MRNHGGFDAGELTNRKEVFSKEMMNRYKLAKKTYDKP